MNQTTILLIIWSVTSAVAIITSLLVNALIGIGIAVMGLVAILFYTRKVNYGGDDNNPFITRYKCMKCGAISNSSLCKKCGGKIAQYYS